jgi:hypothetical protein
MLPWLEPGFGFFNKFLILGINYRFDFSPLNSVENDFASEFCGPDDLADVN